MRLVGLENEQSFLEISFLQSQAQALEKNTLGASDLSLFVLAEHI